MDRRHGCGESSGGVGTPRFWTVSRPEMAHGLACARRLWVINEKKLVEQSGLDDLHARFIDIPTAPLELLSWLVGLRTALKEAWP